MSCLFSIIIPTYNSAATIERCLESLHRQTYRDFEVLVMDGNSGDATVSIIKNMSREFDGRLHLVSEPDQGVYDAMNKGIGRSKGQWLLFLGSDDRLYDETVLDSIAALPRLAKYDLVYGNALFQHRRQIYDGRFSLAKILYERNICHQAIFYKKNLFEKLGNYDLAYRIYADYDYNIKCFSRPGIRYRYVDLVISEYNESDGLTGRNTPDIAFHMKREEYRKEHERTWATKMYRISKMTDWLFLHIKHRLKRISS